MSILKTVKKVTLLLGALGVCVAASGAVAEPQLFKYDALGRVIQVNYPDGMEIRYTYDAAGNRTRVTRRTLTQYVGVSSYIQSANGRFRVYMQGDGHAVLYDTGNNNAVLWTTGTYGSGGNALVFQNDGNLVVYAVDGSNWTPVWNSGTAGQFGSSLTLQDDGNLVIFNFDGTIIWQSNTGGHV